MRNLLEKLFADLQTRFEINDISLIVEENPNEVIPEIGVGGFTPDSHTICVYYDSTNPYFQVHKEETLKSALAHEFHHALRNRYVDWQHDTLLGAMVTEGLAAHFDLEINGGNPKPWDVALSSDEMAQMYKHAEQLYTSKDFDYDAWFFGSNSAQIPKWAGYALGFDIVSKYLEKTGKKASQLISAPSEEFVLWSLS